ncbi:SAM and SH3 domain-containing protein 1-like [Daktulosphaira vitifoliae]|uniref:SAM and SH3 domain-containing protein 1-like n=1 Tax=Daktulosphaira vitifoliae TaxID=58002 RepID=UPI0021AA315A|nr:SAM and SH3 domain-containing protein 1-like [Daktulosphaira vitifoliae]
MTSKSGSNIVVEWLRSLQLGQYSDSFLDNGYDDLEICKQVGDPDLDAIGVFNPSHRNRLLQSVRTLREEGAASVYFTLEESAAIQEECKYGTNKKSVPSPAQSSSSSNQELQQVHYDEYEEGKAELVRIPKLQLKLLLKDKLLQDGIRLSSQPYTTQNGERGYLEGLASRYADLYNTHYRDILEYLDELRATDWAELSPRITLLAPSSPSRSPSNITIGNNPYSHHLYAPGKYSPSSCLSDREEDEIYGLTTAERRFPPAANRQPVHMATTMRQQYCTQKPCLSPRSAYFYEFPPADRPGKKKITLTRFLRNFKTHRRDKTRSQQNVSSCTSRANTPDCLGMTMMDNRNRCIPMSAASSNIGLSHQAGGFEETIHRLKVEEAMVKKERFDREHEDILREIRHGLMRYGNGTHKMRNGVNIVSAGGDETYMYDDEMLRHWYDEPPYESDPEELLMEHANNRVYYGYTKHKPPKTKNSGSIISLPSAGDISLSGYGQRQTGLLLPASGTGQPTIIPLKRQNRESGDYAASDIQSVCSRMSSLSVETNRSDYDSELYQRLRTNGLNKLVSPSHSSDYADQDDSIQLASVRRHSKRQHRSKISNKHYKQNQRSHRHHSSAESLPSTSSIQALMGGASQSSEESPSSCDGTQNVQVLALARAITNSSPNSYDRDALIYNKGDVILVTTMNASGIWKGMVKGCDRIGTFKFVNVQPLVNESNGLEKNKQQKTVKHRPKSLLQLLRTIGMEEQMSVFAMNGFGDLQSFCEIREVDLDYMGIMAPEQRAKILAAVQVMHDYQSPEDDSSSTEENRTDPSCDGSQESCNRLTSKSSKTTLSTKQHLNNDNEDTTLLSSPEYNKKTQKSVKERQQFAESSSTNATAKLNSCTSSEKSSDSGVSSSSSVCFGNVNRIKRNGELANGQNSFGGHLVQNIKD